MSDQPTIACPSCGTPAPQGASVCGNCGAALASAAPVAASPPGTPPPAPPAAGTMPSRPALSDSDSRNWAMASHLTAVAGAFLGGVPAFVGPLVIWLIRREDDRFSSAHALEALNFNITVLGVVVAGVILGVFTLGLGFLLIGPALLVLAVLWLVWTIQAAMAASRGESYRYPLSVRLVS